MRTKPILLLLLLSTFVVANSFAQEIPLVYDIENTGADCNAPPLPAFADLPSIELLTDPFEWSDGSGRSTDFNDWSCRRAEIKAEIEHYEIGPKPDRPDDITASYSGGTLTVNVTVNGNTLTLTSQVILPAGDGPFPAVIGMGSGTGSLPSDIFTSRDIAQITFNFWQVMAWEQTRGSEPINRLYPELAYMGAYSAWSWGVSRLIDGLELVSEDLNIDLNHLAVTGCSFAGKMALFAGAFDERIALTIAQESGGGGAAAWRVSETLGDVEKLGATSHLWFMESMFQFSGSNVSKLPMDHHELMAMVAPRALLVLGNPPWVWLAEESGYVSCRAAHEVWKAFGVPDRFGFSFVGGHDHCSLPTSQRPEVEAFVEKFLLDNASANTDITTNPYAHVDYSRWFRWWATGGMILYVDVDANGTNDGTSWANAYNYLKDALAAAVYGDHVWVAEGIYKPDEDTAYPSGTGERDATFGLINRGALRGGYAGYGQPDPNARDIELYETILSGDLLGNDDPNTPVYELLNDPCRYDNCYNVVIGSHTHSLTILDGFTITAGYSSGMYNSESSMTVTNCIFSSNSSVFHGGGMCNTWYSSPIVTNCKFNGNLANFNGGGICNLDYSSPTVTNCKFNGNSAGFGGGICNENYSSPTVTNCTFVGNSAEVGGGMYNDYSSPLITNCILWANTASSGSQIYNDGTSEATVTYSDVQGDGSGTGNIDIDPCFVSPGYWDANGTPDDMYDDFWVDGDYHLKSAGWRWDEQRQLWTWDEVTSRCIDAGNPGSPLSEEPLTVPDDPNNERGENLRINMGAYGGTAEASIPPYDWALLSDITNDGTADFADYSFLAELFTQDGDNLFADLDRDGTVDLFDMKLLVNDWLLYTTWFE